MRASFVLRATLICVPQMPVARKRSLVEADIAPACRMVRTEVGQDLFLADAGVFGRRCYGPVALVWP